MSSAKAEKTTYSQKKKQQQKQNVIRNNEDLEGFGNDSVFNTLSNIDNKEQKKNNDNFLPKKNSKENSSNNDTNSPKTPQKDQNTLTKTAPIEDLSKLVVSDFIKQNINISDDEEDQVNQMKKLCNFIETEITNKLYCTTTKFSYKTFDIDSPEFKGPISYLAPKQRKEIENVFKKCKESAVWNLFVLISKCIFVGETKDNSSQKLVSSTIAYQICVQIISNLYPGIFYKPGKQGKLIYDQVIGHRKETIEKLQAMGNTIIWISSQQKCKVNKKEINCPEYIAFWMKYFLNTLASQDTSNVVKNQSVKLLNKTIDGVKNNKNHLDIKIKIPLETFIAFAAIVNDENIVSQMKKNNSLYNDVMKAYNSLKSLLFDKSSDLVEFNVPNVNVFNKLYSLLSDPKYNKAVYHEFVNILVLTFGKENSLFDTWENTYQKYQPSNITRSNDIIKEIKNQQTEFLNNKKRSLENNCWKEIDNSRLRNVLYTLLGKNEEYRNKKNENEINEMNKNIRAVLDKTTRSKSDDGFFNGFLMKLLRRSILLVLLISLSLHILDSVDNYNSAGKGADSKFEVPVGHPQVKPGADISKCPYHNFRNKYTNCNQCHPIIKYVYDSMDEPYKLVEKNVVIPAYEKVWKPYISKAYMKGIEKGFIPSYRKSRNIMSNNVIQKASKVYDTYLKEHVDKANENVFKPAMYVSLKYLDQAYTNLKPATIKAKNILVNDVVNPSLPYINRAKVRAIQYGNRFLDVLAEIPYKKLMKTSASNILRFIGYTEREMENTYRFSKPYTQKYWNSFSKKMDTLMKQDNVQKVLANPYVKTTTDAMKDAYRISSYNAKAVYVFLTGRGPQVSNSKNWKRATEIVSVKKDIKNVIKSTKNFFREIILELEKEEGATVHSGKPRTVKVIKDSRINDGSVLPSKKRSPKLADSFRDNSNSGKRGYKVVPKKKIKKKQIKMLTIKDLKKLP
jgi:hypothetical protein